MEHSILINTVLIILFSISLEQKEEFLKKIKLTDLQTDIGFEDKTTARGVAGRPVSETPALEGARRAHVKCDVGVDSLAYWNDPTGTRDQEFVSPFKVQGEEMFLTFTIDRGGWNNVRYV
jgi:hypothetical protein